MISFTSDQIWRTWAKIKGEERQSQPGQPKMQNDISPCYKHSTERDCTVWFGGGGKGLIWDLEERVWSYSCSLYKNLCNLENLSLRYLLLWKWSLCNCFDMFGYLNISALSSIGIAPQQLLCMYGTPSEQLSTFPRGQEQRHKNYFLCKDFPIQNNA